MEPVQKIDVMIPNQALERVEHTDVTKVLIDHNSGRLIIQSESAKTVYAAGCWNSYTSVEQTVFLQHGGTDE